MTIAMAGMTVLYRPIAIPAMIVDGCPVSDCLAIHLTGGNSYEVNHSVAVPIICPTTSPAITTPNSFHGSTPAGKSSTPTRMAAPISPSAPAPKMAMRNDHNSRPMLAVGGVRTTAAARTDAMMPAPAIAIGSTARRGVEFGRLGPDHPDEAYRGR